MTHICDRRDPPAKLKQVGDRSWLVTFDLGFFDDETCRLESLGNPFAVKVLPMSPGAGINRYLSARNAPECTGMHLVEMVGRDGFEPSTNGLKVQCSTN